MISGIRLSRARALQIAAVLSFILGVEACIVTVPILTQGIDAVNQNGDGIPYFVMLAELILGFLRIGGSVGTWQGRRGSVIVTILANALDMIVAAPGILFAPHPIGQLAALGVVLVNGVVILLCFWRDDAQAR